MKPEFTKENFEKARVHYNEGNKKLGRSKTLLLSKDFAGSIEASQHAVEFYIKTLFVLAGLKIPKKHDPGKELDIIFDEVRNLKPKLFPKSPINHLARIKYISSFFSRLHTDSMYGYNGCPPSQIFNEFDARYFYDLASEIMFGILVIAFQFGYHFKHLPEEGRKFLENYAPDLFGKKSKT